MKKEAKKSVKNINKKKEKYYVFLFRHGQTTYNRDHVFTGWKDAKLTDEGKEHAKKIAEKLKKKKIGLAIQSKLLRSKNTLKYVLEYHPECKKIITDNRIIERSYGSLAGYKHSTIINKYGKEQYEKWHRGFRDRPPKGECFADVEIRVRDFFKDLKKVIKKEKTNIAISAHGNSIRLFRKVMEGLSINKTEQINIPYEKVYIYEFEV